MKTEDKIAKFIQKLIELTKAGKLQWLPGPLVGVNCKLGNFEIKVVKSDDEIIRFGITNKLLTHDMLFEMSDSAGFYKIEELYNVILEYGSTNILFIKQMKERQEFLTALREDSERLTREELKIIGEYVEQATTYLEKIG